MPTANEVVQRLRRIGFEETLEPGIPGGYVSKNAALPQFRVGAAFHIHLAAEAARQAGLVGEGSVYVHPATDPAELCGEAVIMATGPYKAYFSGLQDPSGHGTVGGKHPAWCGHAAELLVAKLEAAAR